MNQNTKEIHNEQPLPANWYDDDCLAGFAVHKAQSLQVSFDRQNLISVVANSLAAEVIENLTGVQSTGDEAPWTENVNRVLDKYRISYASDSTFVTTDLVFEMLGDDLRLARSYFNALNARQEIQRISDRFNGDDWRSWLLKTANETAQAIFLDFASQSLQHQRDSLEFVSDEITRLLNGLRARQNDCGDRRSRLQEQETDRQLEISRNRHAQSPEAGANLVKRLRSRAAGWMDLNRYFPDRADSTQHQPELSNDTGSLESFLAQVDFEISVTQIEIAFYNELYEAVTRQSGVLDLALLNSRKKYAELFVKCSKMESKRSFGLAGGEMLLNSPELTKGTIEFLAPNIAKRAVLIDELITAVSPVVVNRCGDVRDRDVTEITKIITDIIGEKLSDYHIAEAIVAMLRFQTTFETQLHESIRQTAATDFFSSGWDQFLTPKINYFCAISYPQSVFEGTNKELNEAIGRIASSLHLNYEMKNEIAKNNAEDFCFYIEYFSLPIESFEFYQQNVGDFEKVKDLPMYRPHPDL
jgi:hypothetical protein